MILKRWRGPCPVLSPDKLLQIGGRQPVAGAPLAALGPGTGLGMAVSIPHATGHLVLSSEGGHSTMAGSSLREDAVIAHLRQRFGHVSAERVLSGHGLENLHEALAALDDVMLPRRRAAEITRAGIEGTCPTSRAAVDMFCAMLGTVAGNLALTLGARGGIFIAGGILRHMPEYLASSQFRARFEEKGRFQQISRADSGLSHSGRGRRIRRAAYSGGGRRHWLKSRSTQIVTLTINPAVDVSTSVKKMVPFTKMRCAPAHRDPGGGGINVARVLKRLGIEATAIYPAGGATGQLLATLVEREGVRSIVIPTSNDTREDITIFDETTREQFRLVFPGAPLSDIEWQECLGSIARITPAARVCYCERQLACRRTA